MKNRIQTLSKDGMKYMTPLAAAFLLAAHSFAWASSSWEALADELMENHPGLEAKRLLIESLEKLPEARMAWDDPMISAGLSNVPVDGFDFSREPMTQKTVGVSQRIPSLSKRLAEKGVAEENVRLEKARTRLLAASLVEMMKNAVYEIAYADRALRILARNERVLDEFITISNAKYATGKGVQADVIQAQVEKSKIFDRMLALEEKRKLAVIRLNRTLGRDVEAPFEIDGLPLDQEVAGDFAGLWEKAARKSPEMTLARALLGLSESGLEKAEASVGMDVILSMRYGQRDDTPSERADFLSAGASVSIPLWRREKQDRLIASARLKVSEAAMELENVRQETKAALGRALASYKKEAETIRLYEKGIIPQARQALLASQAAYQLDKADFLSMLTNELTLLRYELDIEMAFLRKRKLSARIEYLAGAGAYMKE